MTNTITSKSLIDLKNIYNNKETIVKFLKTIEGDGCVTEISDLHSNLGGIDKYDELVEKGGDLYFVTYMPTQEFKDILDKSKFPPRCKNENIEGTSYIRVDFDIRDAVYRKENRVIDDDELLSYIQKIKDLFDEDDGFLYRYSAIVNSGNGAHFYWIGIPTKVTPEEYSHAVEYFLDEIKELMKKNNLPELFPDYACKNISRLMRLPGSMNNKCKYGLGKKEVELLFFDEQDCGVVSALHEVGKRAIEIFEEAKKVAIKYVKSDNKKMKKGMYNKNHLYERINNEIDIRDLVTKYTGWTVAKDGRNFISNRDGQYTGAFVIPEKNILIWYGTPHISDAYEVYTPFSFIREHYAQGLYSFTYDWALEEYPQLKRKNTKFYFGKGLLNND